jgi:hypothetical protein
MKEELRKQMMRSDEDLAEEMKDMSMDEQLAYFRNFYQMIMEDPEMSAKLPPEKLEGMRTVIDSYEQAIENVKVSQRDAELALKMKDLAQAEFDRVVDASLQNLPETEGH